MLKQMFLVHFRPVVTHFDPRKIPKFLESKHTAISFLPLPIALGSTLLWPSCERQIPQDEALYKSGLLRADDPLPHPRWTCNYWKIRWK